MPMTVEDEVERLMAKARPAEVKQMARWAMEMLVAQDHMVEHHRGGIGNRFAAASADRDAQIARDNMRELVKTLEARPDPAPRKEKAT